MMVTMNVQLRTLGDSHHAKDARLPDSAVSLTSTSPRDASAVSGDAAGSDGDIQIQRKGAANDEDALAEVTKQETVAQRRRRFEELAIPALNVLYRQALKLTNSPEDAQDLVQDSYERGFKAFDSFRPGSNFEAWMTTIERNAYFNQYAKAKRRPQRANDSTGEYDDWDIYDSSSHNSEGLKSAEQEYLDGFAPEEILSALDKLSPERREVFIDTAVDGKSYKQVAAEQGVKIGTVMSRLNRARAQLKQELSSYALEQGYAAGRKDKGEGSGSSRPKSADSRIDGQHAGESADLGADVSVMAASGKADSGKTAG
ncbi:RNA polymerase sigma-70 factor family [Bifidobacterium bombi DSM 19703]|uniref:RNA polymerase sigma-70 factor family n=1 Tax=Bifidobacterium bombi DSM 19703 TaxID=1341695 RepID=A0A080N6A6_9BIFI|nr:RNA polymerase sigma-70 factor family [Bifidobacterium bombi DSM 19703]